MCLVITGRGGGENAWMGESILHIIGLKNHLPTAIVLLYCEVKKK